MKSEFIDQLAKSLCAAQSELQPAKKDAKNPFFNSKYADLTSVTEAAKVIHKHGLSYTQTIDLIGSVAVLRTTLLHISGQWIEGVQPINAAKTDPQSFGSALTYARRYGLAAIVGLTQDDDDANASTHEDPQQRNLFRPITSKQRNYLYAVIGELGWTEDQAKEWLLKLGFQSTKDISMDAFNGILQKLQAEQKQKVQ